MSNDPFPKFAFCVLSAAQVDAEKTNQLSKRDFTVTWTKWLEILVLHGTRLSCAHRSCDMSCLIRSVEVFMRKIQERNTKLIKDYFRPLSCRNG